MTRNIIHDLYGKEKWTHYMYVERVSICSRIGGSNRNGCVVNGQMA